jgi:glycosyltransferase involved in cell wall biosynthesis
MKILHIISSGGMYGAEAVILNLSRALNEAGHSSILGVFANEKNLNLQLYEAAKVEGIESHLIPCSAQIDRASVSKLRELALKSKADVVHAHGFKADIYSYVALKNLPVPLVSTCHNWTDTDLVVSIYGRIDRFVLRRYAAVIAVSQAVKNRLIGAGVRDEKIHIIENGIDLRPFDGATPSLRGITGEPAAPIVGFVGRLSKEKGADIFLQVASRVIAEIPHAKFVLVGDGPERKQLESLIDSLGLSQSVVLAGRRTDMPSVYASFDLLVLSSRDEGVPMAVLEGMASGVPWVATAVGDVPKIIQNQISGVLVSPGEVESLAKWVVTLLQNTAERGRIGENGRRRVQEEFSAERMTSSYLNVYREVVGNKSSGGVRGRSSSRGSMQSD